MQFSRVTGAVVLFALIFGALVSMKLSRAQSAVEEQIVVTGEEVPSAYGAPPGFSRARFSPTVTAYVLPPGSILAATIYEGDALRHEKPDHRITQEFEIGFPYRVNVAMETELQAFAGVTQATTVSVEARWALADWNKIPLNPTIFAEYKFGVGDLLHDERVPEPGAEEMPMQDTLKLAKLASGHPRHSRAHQDEEGADGEFERRDIPDAVEGRLLLAQDFGEHL